MVEDISITQVDHFKGEGDRSALEQADSLVKVDYSQDAEDHLARVAAHSLEAAAPFITHICIMTMRIVIADVTAVEDVVVPALPLTPRHPLQTQILVQIIMVVDAGAEEEETTDVEVGSVVIVLMAVAAEVPVTDHQVHHHLLPIRLSTQFPQANATRQAWRHFAAL